MEAGYGNLMDLSSAAFLEIEPTDVPHVKASRLEGRTDGVIALTGGADGVLNRLVIKAGRLGEAESLAAQAESAVSRQALCGAATSHGGGECADGSALFDLAYTHELPLVATNEPYFLDPDMHRRMTCCSP